MEAFDAHVLVGESQLKADLIDLRSCPHRPVPGLCVAAVWVMDRYSLTKALTNDIRIRPGSFTREED